MVPRDATDRPGQSGVADRQVADVADVAELVRQTTVTVLTERIKLLGIDRSGAYEHYNLQLAQGFPIGPGELAVFKYVRERMPSLRSYHEIGSGLGTLPFMLASEGFASVGVERDERRHLTSLAVLRDLAQAVPQMEGNCRLIGGSFPDAVLDLDMSESMAIMTDFVSTQSPRDYARLGHGLARYRYVVMDLQRFCNKRNSRAEYDELIQELAKCGLKIREEVADLGDRGRYVCFESTVASERRPLPGDKPDPAPAAKGSAAGPATAVADAKPTTSTGVTVALAPGELEARQAQPLVEADKAEAPVAIRATALPPMPRRATPRRFGGWLGLSALLVIGLPTILAIVYYGFFASKQYVTTLQFAVRGPSQANAKVGSGGGLQSAGLMSPDSFVVSDYIGSPQAVTDVGRQVDFNAMFAKPDTDFWVRLPQDVSTEDLLKYWRRMVAASFDLISGNITVTVRAFSPADSLKLADAVVKASDDMFRKLNTQIQQDYVRVADENLAYVQKQLIAATQAVLDFREKSGLVDPNMTAAAGASIVDDLRKQLAGFQGTYNSLKATAANSPALVSLKSQITALEEQIRRESSLGSSPVKSVTADTLAKYQTLEIERQTAEKLYGDAVGMRTQALIFAQSQQSYLGLFSAPKMAEDSLFPDRPRAIATVILAAAVAWFIGMLVVYALRDHLM